MRNTGFFWVLTEDEQAETSLKCFNIDIRKAGSQETSSHNNSLEESPMWGKAYLYTGRDHPSPQLPWGLSEESIGGENQRYYSGKHVKVFWPSEKRKREEMRGETSQPTRLHI